jgi:hypothetical protein
MRQNLRRLCGGGSVTWGAVRRRRGVSPKAGRCPQDRPIRQPGQHVDPRGIVEHRRRSDDGVFNNLVLYDQHIAQNSLQSIRPDLAIDWSWDEERTRLTFHLRQGVKWYDGQPFMAQDVRCTRDLLTGITSEKLRFNPRKAWYRNLQEVTSNGDYEVTFHLQRPQAGAAGTIGVGLGAGLSLPRFAARHAQPSGRRRHLQIRRIQAQRDRHGNQKPAILETGPALSRRYRISDHQEPVDAGSGVRQRAKST